MRRRLLTLAAALALLSVSLWGFSSIYGGGVTGGSVFDGAAGSLAGGQFASIYSTQGGGGGGAIAATGQQCNQRTGGAAASVSCTVSVTSGNTVVMFAVINANGRQGGFDATGCSDNRSNVYKLLNMAASIGGLKVCYAPVTTTGSTVFTFTFQGGTDAGAIVVAEFSGVLTSGVALDQTTWRATGGANTASQATFPTTTNVQLVVAGAQFAAAGTLACDTGYTQIAEDESGVDVTYSTCYKVVTTTGTQQHTWTGPNTSAGNVVGTLSAVANGLTGTGIYLTGHSCRTPASPVNVTTTSCVLPVANGNTVILVGTSTLSRAGGADNTGCTDGLGTTWVYGIRVINGSNGSGVKICSAAMTSSAVNVANWTNQGGTATASVNAFEVAGLKTSAALDQTASNTAALANATTGTTGVTTLANELVVASLNNDNPGTLTCGAGYIEQTTDPGTFAYSTCYRIVSSTGTQTMTWTSGASFYAAVIATFKIGP